MEALLIVLTFVGTMYAHAGALTIGLTGFAIWLASALFELFRSQEELNFLLYLRDYANPDGVLPVEFDGLVRESLGEPLLTETR